MRRTDDDPYLDFAWTNYRAYVWAKRFAFVMIFALCVTVLFTRSVVALAGAFFWSWLYDRWDKALKKAWAEYVWERDYLVHLRNLR